MLEEWNTLFYSCVNYSVGFLIAVKVISWLGFVAVGEAFTANQSCKSWLMPNCSNLVHWLSSYPPTITIIWPSQNDWNLGRDSSLLSTYPVAFGFKPIFLISNFIYIYIYIYIYTHTHFVLKSDFINYFINFLKKTKLTACRFFISPSLTFLYDELVKGSFNKLKNKCKFFFFFHKCKFWIVWNKFIARIIFTSEK